MEEEIRRDICEKVIVKAHKEGWVDDCKSKGVSFIDRLEAAYNSDKDQMDKAYDSYRKALSLLTPKGEVIITAWDMYTNSGSVRPLRAFLSRFSLLWAIRPSRVGPATMHWRRRNPNLPTNRR